MRVIVSFNRSVSSIVWKYDGSSLSETDERVTISNTVTLPVYRSDPVLSTFELTSILYEDAGVYTVTAGNVDGNSTVYFNVTVVGKKQSYKYNL